MTLFHADGAAMAWPGLARRFVLASFIAMRLTTFNDNVLSAFNYFMLAVWGALNELLPRGVKPFG